MILHGIKNCGTVKKAIAWLNENDIAFDFHDYKKKGIAESKLQEWINQMGLESLINHRGTTWRKLDDEQKEMVKEKDQAIKIMAANTSVIKRPILENEGEIITIGFDEEEFSNKYGK